jgi:membrane-bound lytic murein transglycosylase D
MREPARLLRTTLLLLGMLGASAPGRASVYADSISDPHAGSEEVLIRADWEYVLDALDSLVAELESAAFRPAEPMADSGYWAVGQEDWPRFEDRVLRERLEAIPTTIPLHFNSIVRNWMEMYTLRNRAGVQRMLGLRDLYFPLIEEELDRRHLPMELKYLAVIESALNPHAVSPQGATGLWQIMYTTGKGLGMRIDTYVDERRDPYAATRAGLDYLQKLYAIYEDWLLVIAAYNCGPGNVNKAIRRAGGKQGIWDIYAYLPRETRGYVPAFISATYAFTYYREHKLVPWESRFSYAYTDTVMLSENVPFSTLAEELGMSVEEIRYCNPALKRDMVPGRSGAYPLRLPFEKIVRWTEREEAVLARLREQPEAVQAAAEPVQKREEGSVLFYRVKSGDTLWSIARAHPGNSIDSIARLNGMSTRATLRTGMTLKLQR